MLLAIDTGNTNTLFAIHDGKKWIVEWRIATNATRTADEYAVWFHQLLVMQGLSFDDISDCVISTVVPQSLFNVRNLSRRHLNVDPIIIGDDGVKIGIGVRNVNPKEVGADRLVTFDVISEDGYFEGGIISPGINLSVKALHEAAAQLPRIEIKRPDKVVGSSTVSAMQSGIFWGYIGLIDGLVQRIISDENRSFTVIGTGGVASLFEGASQTIQHYDSDLTIDGLLEIWRLNK